MDYCNTTFLLSSVIITVAALYVYQSELRMAKQEQTVLQMKKRFEEQDIKLQEMKTKTSDILTKMEYGIGKLKTTKADKQVENELAKISNEFQNLQEEVSASKEKGSNELRDILSKEEDRINELMTTKADKQQVENEITKINNKIQNMQTVSASKEKASNELRVILQKEEDAINELKTTKADKQQVENDISKISNRIQNLQEEDSITKEKGVTYVRWGKTACDGDNTENVYTGQVGGGHYTQKGTSVNYVCLPKDPEAAKPLKEDEKYSFIYGAEYEFDVNKPEGVKTGISQQDVACAVCLAKGKTTSIMIPGRTSCYTGWKREYDGYLMAGFHGHEAASEYACVDKATESIPGGAKDENGKLFFPVKTQCGSLKCPPYTGNTEVLCVVCTK